MAHVVLSGVTKVFPVNGEEIKAVDGASLDIEKGRFVSIVGHSGSGKTTLLSMIGGIMRPTSGSVLVGGTDIYGLDEDGLSEYRAGKVGYVFQFASLLPVLTAKENLLLPTLFAPGKRAGAEERAVGYLSLVGLADKVDAYPSQLSGGQQRRVAIARALMNDPLLILADEPTGDLDEETEQEVMGFFKRLNRERGITFVLVTHSTELAKDAASRFRMSHGRLSAL